MSDPLTERPTVPDWRWLYALAGVARDALSHHAFTRDNPPPRWRISMSDWEHIRRTEHVHHGLGLPTLDQGEFTLFGVAVEVVPDAVGRPERFPELVLTCDRRN